MTIRVLVLRAAGTNCDVETAYAWQMAGAQADRVHVNELVRQPAMLRRYQVLTIPGGFSYGDDIAAGKIFANQLVHHVGEELTGFVDRGGLVLGICNGFQVLAKAGLLPGLPDEGIPRLTSGASMRPNAGDTQLASGASEGPGAGGGGVSVGAAQQATLTWNDSGRYEDRWVWLKTGSPHCAFLEPGRLICLPVAHAEGKVLLADERVRQAVHGQGLVALQYVDEKGEFGGYPINPNGSIDHIAGLTDPSGRILGLMPHPERYIDPTQHPQWSRLAGPPEPCGRMIFARAVAFLKAG